VRSIRAALLARLVLGSALLLVVGVAVFAWMARELLTEQFDAAAATKLSTFAALFEQEGGRVEFDLVDDYLPEFSAAAADNGDAEYFQVWIEERELGRSSSLGDHELPRRIGAEDAPVAFDVELPDDRDGRAIGARMKIRRYERSLFADPGPAQVEIVLARSREGLDRALALLMGGAAIVIVALIAAVAALSRSVADRGLAPVAALVQHVERIDDPTEAPAFDAETAPIELRPIALGLNRLVERLALLLARERRTSANIAHELRTPVSELLVSAEVALRFGDPAEGRKALAQAAEIGHQMRRLIGTLLDLSRLESGQTELAHEPIELRDLVAACWDPLAARAREQGISLAIDGAEPTVASDRDALTILVANLLANAAQHAPEKTTVRCSLESGEEGDAAALVVSNASNGLRPEDLDKLTEPFWRASESRGDREHAGLGLALVRRLAELLGLDVTFALADGELRARVAFPRDGRRTA